MEQNETKTSPSSISVAEFTAFSKKCKKFYEDKDEQYISQDLSVMCQTFVLHSITTYGISTVKVKEYTKPFEPEVKVLTELTRSEEELQNEDNENPNTDYSANQQTEFCE